MELYENTKPYLMLSFEYRFKNSSFHGAGRRKDLKSVRESCYYKLLNTCVKHFTARLKASLTLLFLNTQKHGEVR
jgi:hypothetical protein